MRENLELVTSVTSCYLCCFAIGNALKAFIHAVVTCVTSVTFVFYASQLKIASLTA